MASVTGPVPGLFTVMMPAPVAAWLIPTCTLPKSGTVVVEMVNPGCVAVPLKVIACAVKGTLLSSSVTVTVAVFAGGATFVGANATVNVQLAPIATAFGSGEHEPAPVVEQRELPRVGAAERDGGDIQR